MSKQYYSVRLGKNREAKHFGLDVLKRLFGDRYATLHGLGYFDEYFGFSCVDQGHISGLLGEKVEAEIYRFLRKDGLWPIRIMLENYSEDDLFDIIEFLFDHISKPIDGNYHQYNNCGMHWYKFDKALGQAEYREAINQMLNDYETGFELDEEGFIVVHVEAGFANILSAKIPTANNDITTKIELAVQKYLHSRSNLQERRIAVRELADILESLRNDAKKYLTTADEKDLFNIANNFAIRHFNEDQKIDFDKSIWYNWIFYIYLASIHALLRLIERAEKKA